MITNIILTTVFVAAVLMLLFALPHERDMKIHAIDKESRKVYCIKNDPDGRYAIGDTGKTITGVVNGQTKVNFENGETYWMPINYIHLIDKPQPKAEE